MLPALPPGNVSWLLHLPLHCAEAEALIEAGEVVGYFNDATVLRLPPTGLKPVASLQPLAPVPFAVGVAEGDTELANVLSAGLVKVGRCRGQLAQWARPPALPRGLAQPRAAWASPVLPTLPPCSQLFWDGQASAITELEGKWFGAGGLAPNSHLAQAVDDFKEGRPVNVTGLLHKGGLYASS